MSRYLVIIEADHLAEARGMVATLFGQGEENAAATFVPAGSPSGAEPATHWWLSSNFSEENAATLTQVAAVTPWAVVTPYKLATEPGKPWEVLADMNLQPLVTE